MDQEQKQLNIVNHIKRGIIDVFNGDEDYPSEIIFTSENYGTYKLKPFFYINLRGDNPKEISKAIEMIHDISVTKSGWNLKLIQVPDSDRFASIEWIYYFIDWDSNLDWKENNKDCKYLKNVPNAKYLPIASKKDYNIIQDIWDKYPMTKLENYPY